MVVATLGTTLAPWGLAFIQSYAIDKRLKIKDLGYERVDVVSGALLTGVIGVFIVVACAATLHANGQHIHEASDAAIALRLLAILPFLRALARDSELVGAHCLGRLDSVLTALVIALVAVSVVALGVLSIA